VECEVAGRNKCDSAKTEGGNAQGTRKKRALVHFRGVAGEGGRGGGGVLSVKGRVPPYLLKRKGEGREAWGGKSLRGGGHGAGDRQRPKNDALKREPGPSRKNSHKEKKMDAKGELGPEDDQVCGEKGKQKDLLLLRKLWPDWGPLARVAGQRSPASR